MRKVLVANRGEIALRILRTCRELGLATVAVYSDADEKALHKERADTAYCIGRGPPRESYLNADAIVDVARKSNADAIHPGYGFLAESPEFAQKVLQAGLIWIGPLPEVIEAMGDKQCAREIARRAGIPIVPGSRRFKLGAIEGIEKAAQRVGFPLLVKASAGGGGIGMQKVEDTNKLLETVEATQSMAARFFGDGTIFLERYMPKARHIEVQVFGFGDGQAVHLFERDCSLQRRFQKVIEESPAPGLPKAVREDIAEAALRLARAVSYGSAGTVEFIVDAETFEFFFLEMNTRIQVEHAVTEMVVGCDLVKMQIELARGTLEFIDQKQVKSRGHAIECRLYAENPRKKFLPAPGTLSEFLLPENLEGVRVECGYKVGDTITPLYDPMIAKLISWGETRDEARLRSINALKAIRVDGLSTNREFLVSCLTNSDFAAGDVDTNFIGQRSAALSAN